MSEDRVVVFGGVDTHRDAHVGAVVDGAGRLLGSESFAAEASGYRRMVAWFGSQGRLVRVGVEGTGSYGAGLARYLTEVGIEVVEVNRPNRQLRRQKGGKSDSVDAEGAARAAASGEATAVPKSGDGPVECLRMLLVARRWATKARTQAANQIHSVIVGAPEPVKHQLKGMNLTLDRAHPRNEFDTPKILDDETVRQAFDAWESTRNDVANKWNHLADKTNLKPRSHQRHLGVLLDLNRPTAHPHSSPAGAEDRGRGTRSRPMDARNAPGRIHRRRRRLDGGAVAPASVRYAAPTTRTAGRETQGTPQPA